MVGFPTHLGARQSQAQPITMSFPPQKGFITDKKKKKKTPVSLSEWLVSDEPTGEAGC